MKKYKKRPYRLFVEKDYSQGLLNFLGKDILRDYLDDSNLAISEAQKFSSEVREKSLQTMGWLSAFALALFVAFYSIPKLPIWACMVMVAEFFVVSYGMLSIYVGIIKEKTNQFGGNSLKYLLPQSTLDLLTNTKDDKEKMCQHLYQMLKDKEEVLDAATDEIERMQHCYKQTISTVLRASLLLVILTLVFSLCCLLADVACELWKMTLADAVRMFLLKILCP